MNISLMARIHMFRSHIANSHAALRMPRNFAAAVVITLTTALLLGGCGRKDRQFQYDTAAVTRADLRQYVTASGTLGAVVSVDVGSQVSGRVSKINVDFNDPVKRGQLIAEIDPKVYEASLRQAEGELASAKADVVLKRQNLERKKILVPQRAASQLDLDQATAELAKAQATVQIKQASVDSANANLGYCRITSPVDGVVISRKVDVGQTLAATMSTPVLFTIAQDITRMHISAPVSEADIGQVRLGQVADFTVDAFPDEVFHGRVSQVRKAPTTTSNVVTYETIIDVDNPQQKLFPGMTAEVSILVAEHAAVLKVSNAALRYTPPEQADYAEKPPTKLTAGQRLAYTVVDEGRKLKPVIVKAGISDGIDTEIVEGASEGMQLVTATRGGEEAGGLFGGDAP